MGRPQQRVSRLVELITLVQCGEGWRGRSLARRLGVSRTQIYNDIRVLRAAGVPIRCSPTGYRIHSSYFQPSPQLTAREVLSLLFPFGLFGGNELARAVRRSATDKLISWLPGDVRPTARRLVQRTSLADPPRGSESHVMDEIREAVLTQRRIAIMHWDSDDGMSRRTEIDPYGIVLVDHCWYVVGYSATHNEVREFPIAEIRYTVLTPVHFSVPTGFSAETHWRSST